MERNDIVQTYGPDKQKLAELVILAKGSKRTMAQFSSDTGISAPTLSRIANGKIRNPLSKGMLERIYNQKCKEADYSFDEFLLANGMVHSSVGEQGKNYVANTLLHREYGIALERHAKNAIINAIIDRGITVECISSDYNQQRVEAQFGINFIYDFCLSIPSEIYKLWYFDVVGGRGHHMALLNSAINKALRLFVLDAWSPELLANQKTSFVFENKSTYEHFVKRFKGAPIQSAFSVILINAETEEFIEEAWISTEPEKPGVLAIEPVNRGDRLVLEDQYLDEYYDYIDDNE